MAEMKNCSKVLYFEGRKKKDLFLTVADVDEGPTIRFNVEGLSTMGELKFNGNALKVSLLRICVPLKKHCRLRDHSSPLTPSSTTSHTGPLSRSCLRRHLARPNTIPSRSRLSIMFSSSRCTMAVSGCATIRSFWRVRTRSRKISLRQNWSKLGRALS